MSQLADDTLEQLIARARAGDPQGALHAVSAKLDATAHQAGTGSPRYAAVLFERANLQLLLGMVEPAIASLRSAVAIRSAAPEDEKLRLTYLMNLGDFLASAGKLDEALAIHQSGIVERERFYGADHPGYAYGLDSWADVAIALGRYEDAIKHAQAALAIYDRHRHPRVTRAWALLFLAGGGANATWKQLDISPAMADAVLDEMIGRNISVAAVALGRAVEMLACPRAGDPEGVLRAWVAVEAQARPAGDHASWAMALERIGAIADARGDGMMALQCDLALGLCHGEAGDHQQAAEAYRGAERRARALGSPEALARTLRNVGLYTADRIGLGEGLAILREAAAVPGAPAEERARTRLALGIKLQHAGELAEARALLAAGLRDIDATDPDALCARSHLRAIEENNGCGCGRVGDEISAQVERQILERIPAGFVEAVVVGEGGNVTVRAARELSAAEMQQVNDVVALVMAEMRKRITASR